MTGLSLAGEVKEFRLGTGLAATAVEAWRVGPRAHARTHARTHTRTRTHQQPEEACGWVLLMEAMSEGPGAGVCGDPGVSLSGVQHCLGGHSSSLSGAGMCE